LIVGVTVAVVIIANNLPGISNQTSSAAYMHWSCGGDASCIQTEGSNTGVFQNFDSMSGCENGRIPFDNLGVAQTSWCSTSSNPADAGP
jgi:hypothetical protein